MLIKKHKIKLLENKIKCLGIKKEDIKEKFIKASGKGGQKVNKSSSAVFLKHIPTSICVKVGSSRYQHLNRFLALRSLVEKIQEKKGIKSEKIKKIKKLKKQKRKRKKRAKY